MENKFFDIQVNGYAGVDFNQPDMTIDELHHSCEKLQVDSVDGILATIITADLDQMQKCLQNIVRYRNEDPLIRDIIYGIHIEGPFISDDDGYRGAHPKECIFKPNIDMMKSLLDSAGGLTKIVTLAPEIDLENKLTRMLSDNGIVVSAGHCDPSIEQLKSSIDAGLSMITHLGNGCPQILPRHDNIIQHALSLSSDLHLCFIADGIHIPFYALKNYLSIAGLERSIITTDAMAAASAGPGQYKIGRITLEVGKDGVVREPGRDNFAGSSVTMKQSFINLVEEVGLREDEAQKLTSTNPFKALGIL